MRDSRAAWNACVAVWLLLCNHLRSRKNRTVPALPSAPMKCLDKLSDLLPLVGHEAAVSDWITVTQDQVNLFAQATGDHQWIHTDVDRARAGPFGTTIAHGFLTLSLVPLFFQRTIQIREARMAINYGLNKVRYITPVPVGSRLRARLHPLSCDGIDKEGVQVAWKVTVEREGSERPVCVAEWLSRHYP
jgi:acyl dehydratase